MKMTHLLALPLIALSVLGVAAKPKPQKLTLEKLPEAVRKTVAAQAEGGKIKSIVKEVEDGRTVYEAELVINSRSKDVLIDESGAAIEIEEEIPVEKLPPMVKAVAEKAGKIIRAEFVTKAGKPGFYEIDVKARGKQTEIKLSPEGTPIEQ
jgi:uncharacterized membrane protein YkoI